MTAIWIRIFYVSFLWTGICSFGVFNDFFAKKEKCCDGAPTMTTRPPGEFSGCKCSADVAILLDSSGSLNMFQNTRGFVYKLVRDYLQSPCNASALITFGRNKAKLQYDFGHPASTNGTLAMEIVQGLKRARGQTRTGLAFDIAKNIFNSTDNSDRCDVVVVLTDGGSDNKPETQEKALELKENSNAWVCLVDTSSGQYDSMKQLMNRRDEIEGIMDKSAPNSRVIRGGNFTAEVPEDASVFKAVKNCICQSCD